MSIYPLYCGLAWPTDLVHSLRAVHTLKMWNTNRENIFECFISLRDDDKIFPSKWLLFCSLNSYKCIASFAVLLLVIGKRIAVIRRPEKKRQITARGNLMLFVVLLYWSIAHRFVNSVDIISIQKKTKKKTGKCSLCRSRRHVDHRIVSFHNCPGACRHRPFDSFVLVFFFVRVSHSALFFFLFPLSCFCYCW